MGETLAGNVIYRNVYEFVQELLGEEWSWVAYAAAGMAIILLVTNAVMAIRNGIHVVRTAAARPFPGEIGTEPGRTVRACSSR